MTDRSNLTLEEIGKRAGVSRSTVSRVLNDHPDVRTAVREKVEAGQELRVAFREQLGEVRSLLENE